jgi:hypothetical protein
VSVIVKLYAARSPIVPLRPAWFRRFLQTYLLGGREVTAVLVAGAAAEQHVDLPSLRGTPLPLQPFGR